MAYAEEEGKEEREERRRPRAFIRCLCRGGHPISKFALIDNYGLDREGHPISEFLMSWLRAFIVSARYGVEG